MRTLPLCLGLRLPLVLLSGAWLPAAAQEPTPLPVIDLGVVPLPGPGGLVPVDFVIRTRRQWCRFWRIAHGGILPRPPCDRTLVDFRNELVIATLGAPGTCTGVEIDAIEQRPGSRNVTVFVSDIQHQPGGPCGCVQVLTYPGQAVVVAEPIGRVEFVHGARTVDLCTLTPAE